MMWPLMAIMIFSTSPSSMKAIAMKYTITEEMLNLSLMVTLVLTLNNLMKNQSMSNMESKAYLIITVMSLMVLNMILTDSSLLYLIIMEMTVMPMAYMVVMTSKDVDKISSLKFMIFMNTMGSMPFMTYAYWSSETLESCSEMFMLKSSSMMVFIMLLFLIKTPIFLTHMWLTKVHVSASGNCSMMLASIMIKMGTVGMFKFYKKFSKEKLFYLLISLGLLGAIYLIAIMFRYLDSKTLIAMSSVLHMSLLTPMVMLKTDMAMEGCIMMMSAHGLISYYLFYLITVKYEMTQNRTSVMSKSMESTNKMLTMMMVMFLFLNLGLPPLMNFLSETYFLTVLGAMKTNSLTVLMMLILLGSVMFTMQMNSSEIYGKLLSAKSKMETMSMMIKTMFFLMWSMMLMLCM